MSPLLVEFIGAIVRWLLTAAGAALVARNVITVDQAARFADGFAPALVLLLAPLVWSFAHKWYARVTLKAARELPAGAPDDALRDRVRDLMLRSGE
jgi:hypothetical protein